MAVAFRSASANSDSSGGLSLTITKPSGTVSGDVLVAFITMDSGSTSTITPPSGWTQIRRVNNSTTIGQASFYKVAGGSEPSSYTWTIGTDVALDGGIVCISGADNATVVDVSGTGSTGSSTSVSAASITTTAAGDMLIAGWSINDLVSPSSDGSGMTNRVDQHTASSNAIYMDTLVLGAAGATGAKAVTYAASHAYAAHLVAILAGATTVSRSAAQTIALTGTVSRSAGQTIALSGTVSRSAAQTISLVHTFVRSAGQTIALAATVARAAAQTIALAGTVSRSAGQTIALVHTVIRSAAQTMALKGTVVRSAEQTISLAGGTLAGTVGEGPPVARYFIRVRNSARALLGEVDQYRHFEAVLRYNSIATWVLELDAAHPMAAGLATPGNGIVVTRQIISPSTGIVFSSVVLFSGPIWHFNRKKQGNTLIVGGFDDTAYLSMRDAWPVPSATVASDFAGSAYDTRSGAAETVIRAYVNANLGPGAPAARQVAGLTLATDLGRGNTVHGNARFDQMTTKDGLGILQVMGNTGGIGFKIVQVTTNLQLQFYVPTDRSTTAIFSEELGNLVDFDYALDGPDLDNGGNFVVAGGSGDGTSRVFAIGSNSASITKWGRIESFRDARDTNDATTLGERITDTLTNSAEKTSFQATLAQTPALLFGMSFNLGDIATAVVDGVAISDIIREVNITMDMNSGETVTPLLGSANPLNTADVLASFARQISRVQSRTSRLERAQ